MTTTGARSEGEEEAGVSGKRLQSGQQRTVGEGVRRACQRLAFSGLVARGNGVEPCERHISCGRLWCMPIGCDIVARLAPFFLG